ncbi:MAG: hypothetical protein A07HR60_02272 [uncultured archaeon A07HR60]|nr:MAG: hypothetical protein A07HR60_02272 [uncultured archaeon A07HR60]
MDESPAVPSRQVSSERDLLVPLRIDRVMGNSEGTEQKLYCTDIEGTQLRVGIHQTSGADLTWQSGQWYRFGGLVRSETLDTELRFPPASGSAERVEPPERQTHPPLSELDEPPFVQIGANETVIALTVQPRSTDGSQSIDATDPETFEIGAVSLAPCDGASQKTVYHREEPPTRDEHLLLDHVVEDLSSAAGATLVTPGNSNSSIKLLSTRLALAANGDVVDTGAENVLDDCFHATTDQLLIRTQTDSIVQAAQESGTETHLVSLDDLETGLNPVDWRQDWETIPEPLSTVFDPQMIERDYLTLVDRYLESADESSETAALGRCLKAFASADCDRIRGLVTDGVMDQIGCSRLAGRIPR